MKIEDIWDGGNLGSLNIWTCGRVSWEAILATAKFSRHGAIENSHFGDLSPHLVTLSVEKEAMAVVEAVKHWSHLLRKQKFTLITD